MDSQRPTVTIGIPVNATTECTFCDAARSLLNARLTIEGFELRDFVCPKCGAIISLVVKIELPISKYSNLLSEE
jgi:hypothetical protein